MEKFRYSEMLPHEIMARRDAFPAAFLGLGVLEWHGEHQAVGLDGLKAEALCEMAASRSGGFAFPTLWYAEPRVHRLMEFNFDKNGAIKSKMGLNPDKFSASYFEKLAEQQIEFYQELLAHILVQTNTLEMKAVCFLCGHGPLLDFSRPVVERFNRSFQDTQAFAGTESVYAPESQTDRDLLERSERWYPAPKREEGGSDDSGIREIWYRQNVVEDHAGKWETSYLSYLRPDCVDMSVYVGRSNESLVGIFGIDPRGVASREIGRRACDLIVAGMIHKAKELIENSSREPSISGSATKVELAAEGGLS